MTLEVRGKGRGLESRVRTLLELGLRLCLRRRDRRRLLLKLGDVLLGLLQLRLGLAQPLCLLLAAVLGLLELILCRLHLLTMLNVLPLKGLKLLARRVQLLGAFIVLLLLLLMRLLERRQLLTLPRRLVTLLL